MLTVNVKKNTPKTKNTTKSDSAKKTTTPVNPRPESTKKTTTPAVLTDKTGTEHVKNQIAIALENKFAVLCDDDGMKKGPGA